MPGTLFVVATPIGNLEDITARALRVLREANVIAAEDTRRTGRLLSHYGITTPSTSLHEHNEAGKSRVLLERLGQGEDVALVSDAGTPTLSDPGARLIRAAIDAGIRVEPVPGPSAALAALAVSGLPGQTFTFLGFPPTRSKDRKKWFEEVVSAGRTVVFFESPHRIRATLEELLRQAGDIRVVLARELTKAHEELVRRPLSEALATLQDPRGEFTVVADMGHMPNLLPAAPATDAEIADEYGQLTKTTQATKRQAVAAVARRHGRSPNEVYKVVERVRKSGN